MRYRVKLWHFGIWHAVSGRKAEVIDVKYFRWRWTAFLYELPYMFPPRFPGSLCWTTRDVVFIVYINGKRQYVEMDKHSTQMTVEA